MWLVRYTYSWFVMLYLEVVVLPGDIVQLVVSGLQVRESLLELCLLFCQLVDGSLGMGDSTVKGERDMIQQVTEADTV